MSANMTSSEIVESLVGSELEAFTLIVCAVLLLHEYTITIGQEVELIWWRRWTGPSVLFILNRFSMALQVTAFVNHMFANGAILQNCKFGQVWVGTAVVFSAIIWAAFSALRVYALGGQSWILAMLVWIPAMFSPVAYLGDVINVRYTQFQLADNVVFCDTIGNWSLKSTLRGEIAVRASSIFVDVVILLVTWWKTYATTRMAREANLEKSLSQLLLRDGTLYFLGLLILNIGTLTYYLVTGIVSSLETIMDSIQSIIVARFLLNLRGMGSQQNDTAGALTGGSRFSSVHFAPRAVGNIGGELHDSFGIWSHPDALEGQEDDGIEVVGGGNEGAGDALAPTEDAEITEISRV